mgnify:CR=1 FL=1
MKVREIMSREVRTIAPSTSLREAAELMRKVDIGALIVNDDERMSGVLTDRDIVIRAGPGVDEGQLTRAIRAARAAAS